MTTTFETRQESRIRHLARRHGYFIKKSRKATSVDNCGEYMLVEVNCNRIVVGERFDATLEDIREWLTGA